MCTQHESLAAIFINLLSLLQVPDKFKIDLVCLLEEHENIHPILTEALMEAGTLAIDNMFSKVSCSLPIIICN